MSELEYLSPLGKSDHCVLSFAFDCFVDLKAPLYRFRYDQGNFVAMRQNLKQSDSLKSLASTDNQMQVKGLWKEFKDILITYRNKFVPRKNVGKPSWKWSVPLSENLRNKIKEKRRLYKKWSRARSTQNQSKYRSKYVKIRNEVKREVIQEKKDFERDICNRSSENPKVFWSYLRSHLKTKTGIAPLLENVKDKTSLKSDDYEKANILQEQFCSVFTKEPEGDIPHFEIRCNTIIQNIIITEDMVREEIKKMDKNKAFGPDEISPELLKELEDFVTPPLTAIMNKSMESGTLPSDWKLATISPIYKKGPKNIAANYRPVSLTSIVCKLMEKILIKHVIMPHLLRENLLSDRQYGFISGRSTTTQLLHFLDKCADIIATGGVVDCIYFDFAKAFDTVPHCRLLKKLESYGIKGKLLKWIEGFLKDRYQTVKVNGAESNISEVLSGIPQGSVLGPLLFVMFINDLPDEVLSDMYLFADDTKILKKVDSKTDALQLQSDINAMERWSNNWLLSFHPDKCHVLTFGKMENIKYAHRYKLNGEELEHVFSEKDLGVIMDSDLTFEEHILDKIKKANSILGQIRRSFTYLNPKLLRQLYVTFVRPILEYAQVVWSPKLRKYIDLIEKVQRGATKLIEGFKNLSYQERLRRLNLTSLEYRRTANDMIEIYKHFHLYDQMTTPNKFLPRTRPSRKHNMQILLNFPKDGTRGVQAKSFYYRSISIWNDLPSNVVNSASINTFKKLLDEAWLDHPLRFGN